MVGILIILVVSWLFLYFFSSENLKVLGPFPIRKRAFQLGIGFLFAFFMNVQLIIIEAAIRNASWELQAFSWREIGKAFSYHATSSLTEELLFRGAFLYLIFTKTKSWVGMLISAVAFGIYHWFTFGILDQGIVLLAYVFLTTGLMGFVWAYTFYRTQSIALGWGLHFGWNFATASFLASQPYQALFLLASEGSTFSEGIENLIAIIKGISVPLLMLLYVWTRHKKTEKAQ